jgi:uncharacterized protein YndB with AHSA1/START domain
MDPRDFDPGPLAAVECASDVGGSTLVLVRVLRHAPAAVWTALTDPEALAQWAPFTVDRDLGRVGPATLRMIDGEDHQELPGVVSRAEPPALLEYTWGDDQLSRRLDAVDGGTRLTLRHTVADPDLVPKVAAGWHLCLVVAEHLLDGAPIGPIVGEDAMRYGWQDLHDAYAEQLGITVD